MLILKTKTHLIIAGAVGVVVLIVIGLLALTIFTTPGQYKYTSATVATSTVSLTVQPTVKHLKTPASVKTLYLTACAAATPSLRDHVIGLIDKTELNSVIVDLKDYTGTVAFPTTDPKLQNPEAGGCRVPNLKELVEEWHDKNIYVIGRITVFQDPYYAKTHPELAVKRADGVTVWKDKKGLAFVQVGAKPYWDHIITLSKEAHNLGIDELNFDYVRFPSDGNMQDISFPLSVGQSKPEALEHFFKYLHQHLKDTGVVMSADLFGMTTSNTDDLNIGQVLERALPYFDYIAPMIYPSHYPPQFNGWANPNANVYDLIHFVLKRGVERTVSATSTVEAFTHTRIGTTTPAIYKKPVYQANKIRPWLQDFDYGGTYDVAEVKAQIKATYDAGLNSWMIWDPANRYTTGAYTPIAP
ncbi:MAG: hypothetical protein KBC48_01485 [Candidatus Pacebacteria bacterium]|nr:hypothetical protein [Candidatus Paceibacterota bacterium]